ncbi:MAG: GNAT family N-acetyltransferase [Myxococcota bacterium]
MGTDFYALAGPLALGTRLRALANRMTEDTAKVYALYGVKSDPRWFPVLYVLAHSEPQSVTDLARAVGHTHAAVSEVIKAMTASGLVETMPNVTDGRVRRLKLTAVGCTHMASMQEQLADTASAIEQMFDGSGHDLSAALQEIENALRERDLFRRINDARRSRIAPKVVVRRFADGDEAAFAELNFAWIKQYFRIEDKDREVLLDPRGKILAQGGQIFMAVAGGDILGTVAMVPMLEEDVFELAKMAVSDKAQGLGIGRALGEAALAWAREQGAMRVYLETNKQLKSAITLYRKLGFEEFDGPPSPYERSNMQMECTL